MNGKSHAAIWAGVIVAAVVVALIIAASGGQAPGGRPNHYLRSATPSVTR